MTGEPFTGWSVCASKTVSVLSSEFATENTRAVARHGDNPGECADPDRRARYWLERVRVQDRERVVGIRHENTRAVGRHDDGRGEPADRDRRGRYRLERVRVQDRECLPIATRYETRVPSGDTATDEAPLPTVTGEPFTGWSVCASKTVSEPPS